MSCVASLSSLVGVSLVGVVNDSGVEVGGRGEVLKLECWDEVRAGEGEMLRAIILCHRTGFKCIMIAFCGFLPTLQIQ